MRVLLKGTVLRDFLLKLSTVATNEHNDISFQSLKKIKIILIVCIEKYTYYIFSIFRIKCSRKRKKIGIMQQNN